jgi:hypothetical protein
MFKKLLSIVAVALFVFSAVLPVKTASAMSDQVIIKTIGGKISAVNPVTKTITVLTTAGKLVKIRANKTTVIRRNGKLVTVKKLLVGDRFRSQVNAATMTASSISDISTPNSHAEVYGIIAAVDATAGTLTITPGSGAANVTITVDATTEIKRNGSTATLADFVVGDQAESHYNPVSFLASEVHSNSESEDDEDEDNQGSDMYGIVSAVNTTASTLTILPYNGGASIVLVIDATTKLERSDSSATLADFVVGDKVEAQYDPTTLLASKVEGK